MSLINEYKSTQSAIKELEERLAAIQPSVTKILELSEYVREQCIADGIPFMDLFIAVDPDLRKRLTKASGASDTNKPARKAREVKQYKNPHNGEVVETKGGNHKTLKEWKAKWGSDVVEGWLAR